MATKPTKAMNSTKPDVDVSASTVLRGWCFFVDSDKVITQALLAKNVIAVARRDGDPKTTTVELQDGSYYATSCTVARVLGAMSSAAELAQRRPRQRVGT